MSTNFLLHIMIIVSPTIYLALTYISKHNGVLDLTDISTNKRTLFFLNVKHLIGILLFGLIFLVIAPQYLSLIYLNNTHFSIGLIFLTLLMATISGIVSFYSSQKESIIPNPLIHKSCYLGYIASRLVFLFAYEFFFRGILFFTTLNYFSLAVAVLINLLLYMGIHLFHGKKEVLGAIPFGLVLCAVTYYSQSIWPAFFIHAALSLSYEGPFLWKYVIKSKL